MTDRDEVADADPGETEGRKAERLVFDRVRTALPERVVVLPNVRWISRDHGHEIEGEADLVIADPDRGLLVLEIKAGEIRPRRLRSVVGRQAATRSVAVRAGIDQPAQPRQEAARTARVGVRPATDRGSGCRPAGR